MTTAQLSEKAKTILKLIIDRYIKTAEPVGSSPLVESYKLGWSSATVRNTMSELMSIGYLSQPHVSAGRVPTEKAIRFYIDSLPQFQQLPGEKRMAIKRRYMQISGTIEEVIDETTRMLSDVSRCAGLATLPSAKFMRIESARLIKLGDKKVLVIIVFEGGLTEKTVIRMDKKIPQDAIERMSDYLNKIAFGLKLNEMRVLVLDRLKEERRIYREFFEDVLKFNGRFEQKPQAGVYIKGQTSIFDNAPFAKPGRIKDLFRAFEEKSSLIDILDRVIDEEGTRVFLGSEIGTVEGFSLVAASYGRDERRGTLGVLGPMYMDYSQIIPLVDYTARIVSEIVSEES